MQAIFAFTFNVNRNDEKQKKEAEEVIQILRDKYAFFQISHFFRLFIDSLIEEYIHSCTIMN